MKRKNRDKNKYIETGEKEDIETNLSKNAEYEKEKNGKTHQCMVLIYKMVIQK